MVEGDALGGRKPEMVMFDWDPNKIPADYLQAVGLVAMAAASTEAALQEFIGSLLQIDNIESLALTTHMNAPLRDHIARSLIELNAVSADVVDDVDDLLDAIEDAWSRRNAIVHNQLIINQKSGEVVSHRLKARGSLQLELRPISVEEIKEDARVINMVGLDLISFMSLHGLQPRERKVPLREPLNRSKKARAERRAEAAAKRIPPGASKCHGGEEG
jgi:hypothetical protein